MKENGIANDVAVVVAGNKLLGLIDLESLEAVYTQIRKQLECIRTLDVKISHMVRLIEKSTGVPPRTLFISPVRELGAHYWKGIRTYLRIAQQFNRIAGGLQNFLQAFCFQDFVTPSC